MTGRAGARRMRTLLASPRVLLAARLMGGMGVLVALVAQLGTGPFLHGLLRIDARAIVAALLLAAVATGAAAWRWRVVATRLGAGVRWPVAVAMYYQSQFLNAVLPGGVLGDVRRALAHGRGIGGVAPAARAVVIERTTGQAVQVVLTVGVLAGLGAELEARLLPVIGLGFGTLVLGAAVAGMSGRVRAVLRSELRGIATAFGSLRAIVQVVVASLVVIVCHVVTFGVAAASVGVALPPLRLAAIALAVLLAGSLPLNIGGWGPREGAAALIFAAAGLGAGPGVAASTLFGILAFVAATPGGVLLAASAAVRARPRRLLAAPRGQGTA